MISRAQVCRHVEHLRAWFFVAAVLGMIGFLISLIAMLLLLVPYRTALSSIGISLLLYVLAIYVGGLADSAIGVSVAQARRPQRNRPRNQIAASVARHSLQTPSSS